MPSEFLRAASNGLMRDDDAAGRQHVLNHAQAERKAKVEPYRVRNDLGGKAVATIERITSNF
ncbi:hypothetical protein X749_31865 [Mesorhizobium sp. LNJC391B00]|nr:hypothetical protein X749_31865 [Mesorhizobium sp. LNJC391B00]